MRLKIKVGSGKEVYGAELYLPPELTLTDARKEMNAILSELTAQQRTKVHLASVIRGDHFQYTPQKTTGPERVRHPIYES